MEGLQQDYFFWRLIHHFVLNKNYRVLEQTRREVWLEDEEANPRRILRIVRRDLDFSSWLKRDVVESVEKFEHIRRQLRLRKLVGENMYVTDYPPVDSWDEMGKPFFESKKKRTTVHTVFIDYQQALTFELPTTPPCHSIEEMDLTIAHLKQQVRQVQAERDEKVKSLFFYGKPVATNILLMSIAVMFYLLETKGSSTSILTLIEFGAKFNPLILEGEWWRLVTAMFLHIGFLHVLMNSLALYYLGSAVERMYGTVRFIFIYFVAGLAGSVASFAFNEQVAAGASGAIFGLFGALLYFGVIHKKLFLRTMGKSVITILLINLIIGFSLPMVDNGAHIGGLLGGFLASSIVQLPRKRFVVKQLLSLSLTALFIYGLFWYGTINENKLSSPMIDLQIGQEYLQLEELEKAYPFLQRAVEQGADLPEATFLLAYLEAMFGNYSVAKELFLETIERRPEFDEAHYNLALIYMELGQIEDARASIERAVNLKRDETYLDLQKQLTN
ncbi:rhomboid family intramembrane serine protease [Halalkalibacter krulwichiae]|uniref:Rhomboid protease GluP n=1 Tax=Halalkalibacter krulwichiae TaxID=199441 RepID=A0A1X9M7I3_9BACI|nr:rhomboid family intramembrane serine protease [Halalkalibacter krulwichiae]ARK29388.1 Rhomboid protease GluP [Halalkalibacter krulwichiae]